MTEQNWEYSYVDTPEGKCAEVLVSAGYGAGWVTWNGNDLQLAADKRVIDFFKAHSNNQKPYPDVKEKTLKKFFKSIGIEGHLYFSGFYDCYIKLIPVGKPFRFEEYDGAETIEFYDPDKWSVIP